MNAMAPASQRTATLSYFRRAGFGWSGVLGSGAGTGLPVTGRVSHRPLSEVYAPVAVDMSEAPSPASAMTRSATSAGASPAGRTTDTLSHSMKPL